MGTPERELAGGRQKADRWGIRSSGHMTVLAIGEEKWCRNWEMLVMKHEN